ncbi:MAG: hypothetical protein FWH53_09640 [Leptospirales bacterium]|nr:hypothetical protein [Leptospirales bacterium]
MINDFIDTVFKRIVALNSLYDLNSIPHSDAFFRDTEFLFGLSTYELDIIIKILNESHKIFIMEISREEYDSKKEKIYGYVDTDILNVEKLQSVFHRGLIYEYERVYNNRKGVHLIIKELMPNLKSISNSIMGILLNKVVMLDSYIYFLQKNQKEYTEEWKNEHLQQQIAMYESIFKKGSNNDKNREKNDIGKEEDTARPIRAVDSPLMEDFTELVTKGAIARVLQIYGVVFFFRVHLRNYKFSYLSQVIDTGVIDRKNDLLMVREMLKKVKENINKDKELEKYYDDIMSLDIKISRSMSSSKK